MDRTSWGLVREVERPRFEVAIGDEGGRAVVSVTGDLDIASVSQITECLTRLRERGERDVVVDLSRATFLDSSGLRALLAARRRLEDASGRLVVRNPAPCAERVLEVSGLAEDLVER